MGAGSALANVGLPAPRRGAPDHSVSQLRLEDSALPWAAQTWRLPTSYPRGASRLTQIVGLDISSFLVPCVASAVR